MVNGCQEWLCRRAPCHEQLLVSNCLTHGVQDKSRAPTKSSSVEELTAVGNIRAQEPKAAGEEPHALPNLGRVLIHSQLEPQQAEAGTDKHCCVPAVQQWSHVRGCTWCLMDLGKIVQLPTNLVASITLFADFCLSLVVFS